MDQIEFQENLIWKNLGSEKCLLELTTFEGISYWWNIDYLFYNFIRLTTESRGAKFSITKRNAFTTKLFGSRVGIIIFLLLEISLFLYGRLLDLIIKPVRRNKRLSPKKVPKILVISSDAAWVATPSYMTGVVRKSDSLKDSVMEVLRDKVEFFGTSSFRYRKSSFKIAIERSLSWDYSYHLLNVYWTPRSWLKQKRALYFFKNQWQSLIDDPKFRDLCYFDNIDLFEPIINELKYYFFFLLPLSVSWMETFSSLINRMNPSLAFISNESGHSEKSLVIAAKKQHVPALAMQHGIIVPTNRGYIYSTKDISPNGSIQAPYNPISDKVAVFGTKYEDLLINQGHFPKSCVVVTGNPKFDKLLQMVKKFKDRQHLRRWLNIPAKKPILLWTTQTHWLSLEENLKNIDAVYTAIDELNVEVNLIVKLHPNEDQQAPLYRGDSRIDPIIMGRDAEILQLIYASDILLTKHSMTATEAVALNKPVIILNLSGMPDVIDCVQEGVAVGVYTKEDLKDAIMSLLHDDSSLASNRPNYIDSNFYLIDGKSSKRMAQLMLSMISTE